MKLITTIDINNAAFYGDVTAELEACMRRVVAGIVSTPCGPNGCVGTVRDSNGNTVGTWKITAEN